MIKGLDDDEIEFLDLVDRTKLAAERKKNIDEERELNEYRNRVATLQEKSLDQRLQAEIITNKPPAKSIASTRQSQMKLLKGAVVTKAEPKKRKHSESENGCSDHSSEDLPKKKSLSTEKKEEPIQNKTSGKRKLEDAKKVHNGHVQGAMACIGILPGLGCYNDSSESDASTDSEAETKECVKIDMLGRHIIKKLEKTE